jgi:hypothetical protein
MSNQMSGRILFSIFCGLVLVMSSMMAAFVFMGVAPVVFPIFIPIMIGVLGVVFVMLACVALVVRSVARAAESGNVETAQPVHAAKRRIYSIPASCPNCGRDLELSEVEWRDANTIVCPGCYNEISVKRSAW